jgi:hypothetical protein
MYKTKIRAPIHIFHHYARVMFRIHVLKIEDVGRVQILELQNFMQVNIR